MATATKQGMSLAEGLALADRRLKHRQRAIKRELAELAAEGLVVTVSTSELLQLEQAGLVYEFATGLVQVGQP